MAEKAPHEIKTDSPEYLKYKSYFGYITDIVKSTSFWGVTDRIFRYLRRYFFISKLIKYVAVIFSIIETSAILILIFSFFIILIPAAVIILLIVTIVCLAQYLRYTATIIRNCFKNPVYVIFSSVSFFGENSKYLNGFTNKLSEENFVLIVSRSYKSDRFLVARKVSDRIFVIKLNFFYFLKFSGLGRITENIVYIT